VGRLDAAESQPQANARQGSGRCVGRSSFGADVAAPEKRLSYFHTGQADIIKALTRLPPTQHPLDKADNFVVDLYAVPNLVDGTADGLMVTIQGELTESASVRSRSS